MAGLIIEQLVEPLPNETFQRTRPDSCQRIYQLTNLPTYQSHGCTVKIAVIMR